MNNATCSSLLTSWLSCRLSSLGKAALLYSLWAVPALSFANQYVGVGVSYGQLTHVSSDETYPLLNGEVRMGLDFTDRFALELEGGILGKGAREFESICLNQDIASDLEVDVDCGYLDSVGRQTLKLNALYTYPMDGVEVFAGLGVGAVRTKYAFNVETINVDEDSFDASDLQTAEEQLNFYLGLVGFGPIDLQVPESVNETSIDFLYSLEAGAVFADHHRIAVSWNPEYGSDSVGKYSYLGFSYSWIFHFADF